jgi:glucan phosphoethanolaminetransferase (alkaline phosphatase superfamily)
VRISPPALIARLTYAAAMAFPAVLIGFRDPLPERWVPILSWALLTALGLAFLPRRVFRVLLVITWIAVPAMSWWCGYTALNGIGPGLEAGRAALATNVGEAREALVMVSDTRGFVAALLGHVSLLALSTVFWLRSGARDIDQRVRKAVLALTLLPISASCAWEAVDIRAPALITHIDALSTPVGTYAEIAMQAFTESVIDHFFPDPFLAAFAQTPRAIPHESAVINRPILSVLVMGESVRFGGLGPGNENRGPWSHALSKRIGNGLGTWLPRTCASANGTLMSVPMFLTGTTPSNYREADTAPSGLARLHAAGFRTALISNQGVGGGFWEDGHDYVWTSPQYGHRPYDQVMLPLLETFAARLTSPEAASSKPMAAVLHMMGSHFVYSERYPEDLFPPFAPDVPAKERNDLEYERANEYGAKNLAELAAFLDKIAVPAFVVYVSDHGDNLEHDHNGVIRHLGPRTTQQDGFVSALVLWNRAMMDTGRPIKALERIVRADVIAHRDVYLAWMALSGLEDVPVEPTKDPTTRARLNVGEGYRTVSCSALRP